MRLGATHWRNSYRVPRVAQWHTLLIVVRVFRRSCNALATEKLRHFYAIQVFRLNFYAHPKHELSKRIAGVAIPLVEACGLATLTNPHLI